MFGKKPWKSGKPTKCAKRGFQGKCRKSCDDCWGPRTDIEFCTPEGTMSGPSSKEELLAKMGGFFGREGAPPIFASSSYFEPGHAIVPFGVQNSMSVFGPQ